MRGPRSSPTKEPAARRRSWPPAGASFTAGSRTCATSPALCVLEKLVHIEDPALLPELDMMTYEAPDAIAAETIALDDLPHDWPHREDITQRRGDAWHDRQATALLFAPSAIVPLARSPDMNVLINPRHPASADIRIVAQEAFTLDTRLF